MNKIITLFFLLSIYIPKPLLAMEELSRSSRCGQPVTQYLLEEIKLNKLAALQVIMSLEYKNNPDCNQVRIFAFLRTKLEEAANRGIFFTHEEISSITCGENKQPLLHAIVLEADEASFDALLRHSIDIEEKNKEGKTAIELALERLQPQHQIVMKLQKIKTKTK